MLSGPSPVASKTKILVAEEDIGIVDLAEVMVVVPGAVTVTEAGVGTDGTETGVMTGGALIGT